MKKFVLFFFTVIALFAITQCTQSNAIGKLPIGCVAPLNAQVQVATDSVFLSWNLDTAQYTFYRVQYRKANLINAAWTLKLVDSTKSFYNVPRTSLSNGTYTWGVRGLCKTSRNWSPVIMGSNFTLTTN